jgi:hypothetical protein
MTEKDLLSKIAKLKEKYQEKLNEMHSLNEKLLEERATGQVAKARNHDLEEQVKSLQA